MSLDAWFWAHKASKRARREGRKPYPQTSQEWVKFFLVLGAIFLLAYLLMQVI